MSKSNAPPADPFDAISTYKSTDEKKGDHVQTVLAGVKKAHDGDWVVVRFVDGVTGEPAIFGFPLTFPRTQRNTAHPVLGAYDNEQIAFLSEDVAKEVAASTNFKIAKDIAMPAKSVLWRVLITSVYDGSRQELYRGKQYKEALEAFATAKLFVERERGQNYLHIAFEGVARVGVATLV